MPAGQHSGSSDPARTRAVAVVGHRSAGGTTLVEALLAAAGAVVSPGDVQDGSTVCDREPVEHALGHSVSVGITALEHRGCRVQLLDAPGGPDFVAARTAGLRGADAVVFVVSAAGGLDPVTADLWARCEAQQVPRVVVVSQLDRARADFDEAVALCQRLLSPDLLPVQLPMHDDDGSVAGLISLLDARLTDHTGGGRVERDAEPEHLALVADLRAELVEAVLAEAEDDALLDDYLDGQEPPVDVLRTELHRGVAAGVLTPVHACAPLAGVGVLELLDLMVDGFPSPLAQHAPAATRPDGAPVAALECDPDGPLAAEVLRVDGDAVWVRVWSGTLGSGPAVVVDGEELDLRPGSLAVPMGAALEDVDVCGPGRLCLVRGTGSVRPGDTLSSAADPLRLEPWRSPTPQHAVALEPAAEADAPLLRAALDRVVAPDPTARVEPGAQLVLWCLGPDHAEALLWQVGQQVPVRTVDVVPPADGAWSAVEVRLPTAFAGTVRSDLAGRRARAVSVEPDAEDDDRSVVRAQLPDAELVKYALVLRRLSHGTAHFSREPCPPG